MPSRQTPDHSEHDPRDGQLSCGPGSLSLLQRSACGWRLAGQIAHKFHFASLGSLCVIGHQTACAELTLPFARTRTVRFSGLSAWLMWRGIYLSKLPGLERKIRVLFDWTVELFFPRDIVQTIDLK